jgi:hypothetical protein
LKGRQGKYIELEPFLCDLTLGQSTTIEFKICEVQEDDLFWESGHGIGLDALQLEVDVQYFC